MQFNRSVPPCAVIPVLIYPDPNAATDWLVCCLWCFLLVNPGPGGTYTGSRGHRTLLPDGPGPADKPRRLSPHGRFRRSLAMCLHGASIMTDVCAIPRSKFREFSSLLTHAARFFAESRHAETSRRTCS